MPCALTRTRKQRSRSRHGPASRVGFIALSKGLAENWSQLLSCSSIREGMLDKSTHHPSQVLTLPTQNVRWKTTADRARPRESI